MQQTTQNQQGPQNPLRAQWMIWGALFAFYFLYAFLAKQAASDGPREDWLQLFLMKPLLFMSGIMLVLSHILPKRIFIGSLRLMQEPSREAIIMRTTVPSVISWALNESVAVYGLVLAFRTADMMPFYVFAGVGALNMLVLRPNPEKWLNLAKELTKQQRTF